MEDTGIVDVGVPSKGGQRCHKAKHKEVTVNPIHFPIEPWNLGCIHPLKKISWNGLAMRSQSGMPTANCKTTIGEKEGFSGKEI